MLFAGGSAPTEMLADVANGGMWHVGFFVASGIPEMLLAGRERDFLAGCAFPVNGAARQAPSTGGTSRSSPA